MPSPLKRLERQWRLLYIWDLRTEDTGGFMNFELSKEQREVKERAAEFADREVAPYAEDWDREARFPAEVFEKLAEAGFMGLCVPEEYGGGGGGFFFFWVVLGGDKRGAAG